MAKCSVCGRQFHSGGVFTDDKYGSGIGGLASMISKPVCPDCKRAGAFSGGGAGGAGGSAARDKAEAKIAKDEAERARIAAIKANHKAAVNEVKNYSFDESSDDNFTRSAMNFMDEYTSCSAGLFADVDYKKAYKKRIENELKILKTSNQERAEKLQTLYDEAQNTMKKKLRVRLIISGVIILIGVLGIGISMAVNGGNFGTGALCGLFFGAVIGSVPQMSMGGSKQDKE